MPRRKRNAPPEPYKVTITRYVDAQGRRSKKGEPGATKVTEKSDTYYADLPSAEPGGKPERVSLQTTDLGLAWDELKKKLRGVELARLGIGPREVEHGTRALAEHVEDWCASVRDGGTTEKQVQRLKADVLALANLVGWKRLADVTETTCLRALARLVREGKGRAGKAGRSAQTRNHHLSHVRQFVRWAVRDGRMPRDPLARVLPVPTDADRRHDRRAPTEEEVGRLFRYLAGELEGKDGKPVACKRRKGMDGAVRALAYKVAMATGFRASEVMSLSRASFDLAAAEVTVAGAYSKRRRNDTQGLPPWLVDELKAHFAAHPEEMPWGQFPTYWPGRLLKDDLRAAGVPYEVASPKGPLFFDFHSLRHWYVTWAVNLPGMDVRTLLSLTRLSSTELLLKVYGHAQEEKARRAAEQVPPLGCFSVAPAVAPPGTTGDGGEKRPAKGGDGKPCREEI